MPPGRPNSWSTPRRRMHSMRITVPATGPTRRKTAGNVPWPGSTSICAADGLHSRSINPAASGCARRDTPAARSVSCELPALSCTTIRIRIAGTGMIEIKQVSKWYGATQVLDDCSTQVAQGEVVVVCGPSGSGKSTLIKTVNGLEPFQKGEIFVDGVSVGAPDTNLPRLRARIGMVFQSFELFPHLS